jgi:hypothetical protein
MTNLNPSEKTMHSHRKLLPWITCAAMAFALLAASGASAQTISSTSTKASGTVGKTATISRTGLGTLGATTAKTGTLTASTTTTGAATPEAVALSGVISLSANYIPDPAGGAAAMAYFIDATGISGVGATSGMAYHAATGQASSTRYFLTADTIQVTMPFYPETADGFRHLRTMLVTLNVKADPTTHAVTAVASSIGDFIAQ